MAPTNPRGDPKGVPTNFNPHDYVHQAQGQGHGHGQGGRKGQQHVQSMSGSSSIVGTPAGASGNRGGSAGNGHHIEENSNNTSRMTQPTPLFERLVTEEVQELKAYARIIENQNRRLAELERVHGDLESRLELESRGRAQLETTLEEREREWSLKFQELEADRDHWKEVVSVEQKKNARLIDQVVRKDQDIHRMLQRKYDSQRDTSSNATGSIRNVRQMMNERPGSVGHLQDLGGGHRVGGDQRFKSPHEILSASGSIEALRVRNVKHMISDFFGL